MTKLTIFFISAIFILKSSADYSSIIRRCASCICEAATNCDALTYSTCPYKGRKGEVCGPLQITKPYWAEAGSPTIRGDNPSHEDAFGNCVTDLHCAAQTMQQHMAKNLVDCNSDGMVNCDDYALIHIYGKWGCRGKDVRDMGKFSERFFHCKMLVNGFYFRH